jgi:IS30 family transposase
LAPQKNRNLNSIVILAVCCASRTRPPKIGFQPIFYSANCVSSPIIGDFLRHQVQKIHKCNRLLDNGKEFAVRKALSRALGLNIYFAHPYHSWERGLNEHTNGLIRQYLPKKIPFDTLTQKQLDKIVDKINNRPRI